MKTVYLKVDVPDGAEIIGCDIWVEQFCETYKKQSHLTEFTEIQIPTDEEIENEFPGNPHAEAYVGNLLNKARREGARWVIAKIKNK